MGKSSSPAPVQEKQPVFVETPQVQRDSGTPAARTAEAKDRVNNRKSADLMAGASGTATPKRNSSMIG